MARPRPRLSLAAVRRRRPGGRRRTRDYHRPERLRPRRGAPPPRSRRRPLPGPSRGHLGIGAATKAAAAGGMMPRRASPSRGQSGRAALVRPAPATHALGPRYRKPGRAATDPARRRCSPKGHPGPSRRAPPVAWADSQGCVNESITHPSRPFGRPLGTAPGAGRPRQLPQPLPLPLVDVAAVSLCPPPGRLRSARAATDRLIALARDLRPARAPG
jgi:hypothetical protein